MLHLCITRLPLIFQEEQEDILTPHKEAQVAPGIPQKSIDIFVKNTEKDNPGKILRYAFWDQEAHPNQVLRDVVEKPDDHYEKSK